MADPLRPGPGVQNEGARSPVLHTNRSHVPLTVDTPGVDAREAPRARGLRGWPAYNPDKARAILRQARADGTTVILQVSLSFPYLQHIAEVVQAGALLRLGEHGFQLQ